MPTRVRNRNGEFGFVTNDGTFIADVIGDPSEDVGVAGNLGIQAVNKILSLPDRVAALTGDDSAQQRLNDREQLMAPLAERHPISSFLGANPDALIPGRKAPVIVTDEMIQGMRPGSVIVDLAVAAGGNVEGSVCGENVVKHNVTIIGEPNLPAMVANDASRMWARNVLGFAELMIKEGKLAPNWEDEIIAATVVTHDGQIKHEGAAEALSAKGTN